MKKIFTSILFFVALSMTAVAQCYVLEYDSDIKLSTGITSFSGVQSKALALDGVPYQLTFEGKQDALSINNCYVQYSTDGAKSWSDLVKPDCGTSYKSFGPYELPKNATHIRFNAKTGSTNSRTFRNIKVTCRPTTYGEYNAAFCEGDSIEYNGVWYKEAFSGEVMLVNQYDVDSIVTLTVSVNPTYFFEDDQIEIEEGTDSLWHEISLAELAVGEHVLYDSLTVAETGCDSVWAVNVVVTEKSYIPTAIDETMVAPAATKFFRNGSLYIRRGEALYDMSGRKVE